MRPSLQRLLLSALAVLPLVGCSLEPGEQPPRRIFLITVDTLRADHLGAYGYERPTSPAIDRLAAQSVRFDQAIVQWPLTGPSFSSMMSGLYPRTTGRLGRPHVPPPEGVMILPEFLRQEGYKTVAVVSNRVLSSKVAWDRGFDEYLETWAAASTPLEDPAVLKSWLTAPRVNELALPLLERHQDARRLFVWLHYSDPHTPYTLPDDFENPFSSNDPSPPPEKLSRSIRLEGFETVGDYVANYDANVLIADRGVGEALDRARELGLLDDAVVFFTADHGESLGENDYYFRHGRFAHNATVRVPLLVSGPGRFPAGTSVGRPVELLDLYPTVRELVAPAQPAPDLPGSSLLRVLRGEEEPDRVAVVESGKRYQRFLAAQNHDWKLIVKLDFEGAWDTAQLPELYRVSDDPGEIRNLIWKKRDRAAELRAHLERWLSEVGSGAESEPDEELDEDTRQALEALGYLD